MKNILSIIILIFCVQLKVKSQDSVCVRNTLPKYYAIEKKKLDLWRKDINGCLYYRKALLDSLVKNKKLIGIPKDLFILLFGRYDIISEKKDILIYYVNCKCDTNNQHLNDSNVIQAIFIFIDEKLDSIEVSMT